MLIIEDDSGQKQFELQVRTKRAVNSETQELTMATFCAGFAAENFGEARVSINLNIGSTTHSLSYRVKAAEGTVGYWLLPWIWTWTGNQSEYVITTVAAHVQCEGKVLF